MTIVAAAGAVQAQAPAGQATQTPPAPPANAAPDQPPPGEIIVTAQKRSESLSKVPLAIQAFDSAALKRAGISDTSALTAVVPGLTFAKSGLGTPIYTLRGIGFNTQNLSATSPVGVYQNEVAWAYPYMSNGPLYDIERVEVLKGPQGTLYGRNTTGGLINYITARPTRSWQGSLTGGYGNYETYGFDGFVSGPLTNTLGLRIAFKTENEDEGWQKSVSRDDRLGKKDRQAVRGSLDWKPIDGISSQFTVSYWRDHSDTQAPQAVELRADQPAFLPIGIGADILAHPTATQADWDPREPGKPPFRFRSDFVSLSERLEGDLSDRLKLVSLTGYSHLSRNDMNDADGTQYEFAAYNSIGRINSFSQEIRLQGSTLGDRFSYIIGGYYAHDKILDSEVGYVTDATIIDALRYISLQIPQNTYTAAQIANGFSNFYDKSDQTTTTKSVFANVEYKFTSELKLNAGLRYSSDRQSASACSYDYNGNDVPIFNLGVNALTGSNAVLTQNHCLTYSTGFVSHPDVIKSRLDPDNVSYRASLSYQPTPEVMVYASIARGYKSGAFPVIPANLEVQFEPAKEERIDAYEAGVKSSLLRHTLQLQASGFYYDYTDKQTFGFVPDPVFVTLNRILNIPKSRVYGVEAEASLRAGDFNFQLNGTYLKSEIRKYEGYNDLGQPENFKSNQFTFTPKLQLTGAIDYHRTLTEKLGVDANFNGSYQSLSFGDLENSEPYRLKGYFIANASLGLFTTDKKWRIAGYVKNLGNTYYWNYTGYVRDAIIRMAGMPRTYGMTITRNF